MILKYNYEKKKHPMLSRGLVKNVKITWLSISIIMFCHLSTSATNATVIY